MHPAAIGPFKIERELGRGGMGEVDLVRDTRLDCRGAIKALPVHLAQDADPLARFQREAKVLASLNHPGIGAICGLEEAGGHQYRIPRQGPIAVEDALAVAGQMGDGSAGSAVGARSVRLGRRPSGVRRRP